MSAMREASEGGSWWSTSPQAGAAPGSPSGAGATYEEVMAAAAASRSVAGGSPRPIVTLHRVGSGRTKDPREYDQLESRLKALQKKINLVRSHIKEADDAAAADKAAELAEAEALAANTRANMYHARGGNGAA